MSPTGRVPECMNRVDVSVIIPVRNRAQLVAEAVKSVFVQDTEAAIEVIVVDDGSTDGSGEVAAAIDRRVRVFRHEKSRGPGAARNTGIRESRGEFIAFLDSDDLYMPNRISSALRYLCEHPEVILTFGATRNDEGEDCFMLSSARQAPVYWKTPLREMLICGNPLLTLTVTVRAAVLKQCGSFDETLYCSQDYDLWLRLADFGAFVHLDQVVGIRRMTARNQMSHREARINPAMIYEKAWQRARLSAEDKVLALPKYAYYVQIRLRQLLRERNGRQMQDDLALFREALGGIERLAWGMLARLVCLWPERTVRG